MTVKGKQMEASQVPHLSSSELAASRCRWSRYLVGKIKIIKRFNIDIKKTK